MSIAQGMKTAGTLLKDSTAKELKAQGHYLTGALAQSITPAVVKIPGGWHLVVTSMDYQKYLHYGVAAEKASFKQFPFIVRYWQKRGLELKEAKGAAAATIRKWMKEGMPTRASLVYSTTGTRLKFLDDAYRQSWANVNDKITKAIDLEIDKEFHKTKSETI